MSADVITFPEPAGLFPKRRTIPVITSEPKEGKPKRVECRSRAQDRKNMQTLLFRSSRLIVESDDADLVRDVGLALDKAQTKLGRIKRRLKDVQEQAAAQVLLLTTAETKLSAAIVAALPSTRGGAANG